MEGVVIEVDRGRKSPENKIPGEIKPQIRQHIRKFSEQKNLITGEKNHTKNI